MAIFGRFTERAQRALAAAQRAAAEMRQPYVGTEHLLLGLLKEDTEHLPPAIGDKVSYEQIMSMLSERRALHPQHTCDRCFQRQESGNCSAHTRSWRRTSLRPCSAPHR